MNGVKEPRQKLLCALPAIKTVVKGLRKESAKSWCGPCPRCGGDNRFVFKEDVNRFFCRGCHEKQAGLIDFHMWIEGVDYAELCKKYKVDTDAGVEYLTSERAITQGTVEVFQQDGKLWTQRYKDQLAVVAALYTDFSGNHFNKKTIQYIHIDDSGAKPFKKKSKPGDDSVFFIAGNIGQAEKIVLVESVINALTVFDVAPHWAGMALGSSSYFRKANALLSYRDKIVTGFDNDRAGERVNQQVVNIMGGVRSIKWADTDPPGFDLNDLLKAGDRERIRSMVLSAEMHAPAVIQVEDESEEGPRVRLVCAADIKPETINWLWIGWLAAGKVHILAGIAGHGKSTLLFLFAATISIGGQWPDGSRAPIGDVVIWSGEDDPADTIVPRLIACGADLNRIYIVQGVVGKGEKRSFDPAMDIPILRQAMAGRDVKLLIVDPIVSAVSGDSHKNAEVRRSLQPLVDLAAEMDCAVYGVTHFTKGTAGREPIERVTSSLAFGALTRVVTVAMKLPEGGDHPKGARLLARAKSNIGPDGGGFYYFIEVGPVIGYPEIENTRVLWGPPVEGTARELLARAEALTPDDDKTSEAVAWLKETLADGPREAKDLLAEAQQNGITRTTLQRAKDRLKARSTKVGFAKGWGWYLPEDSIQPAAESSAKNNMQVIDSVEDSAKIPTPRNLGGDGIFTEVKNPPEDSNPRNLRHDPVNTNSYNRFSPEDSAAQGVGIFAGSDGIFDDAKDDESQQWEVEL